MVGSHAIYTQRAATGLDREQLQESVLGFYRVILYWDVYDELILP